MTEVPHQSLNGPRALGTLSLARNRIKLIKPNDFSAQRDLKKIILTGNDLTVVEGGSFSGMSKLREIRLSVNSISRLNSDVFTGENREFLPVRLTPAKDRKGMFATCGRRFSSTA